LDVDAIADEALAKDAGVSHLTQRHPSTLSQPAQRDLALNLMNKKNDIKLVSSYAIIF
jgi:hypothetical protein